MLGCLFQGTGSKPPRWNGWQRRSRGRRASAPRPRPWRVDRLPRVDRAGRLEPAGPRQERREKALVEVESTRDGAARAPGAHRRRQPRQRPRHARGVVLRELPKGRRGRRRTGVDDEPQPASREEAARAPEDLAQAPPDAVARPRRFPRGAEPRSPGAAASRRVAGEQEDLDVSSGNAHPGGVALFEFPAFAEAVVPGEGLGDDRARVHTASLLRPLRRRAEMNGATRARPHPDEEAVRALAAAVVGLVGALHKEGEC